MPSAGTLRLSSLLLLAAAVAACGGGQEGAPVSTAVPESKPAPVEHPGDLMAAGRISGRVTFAGRLPEPQRIDMSADPRCAPAGAAAFRRRVVVGQGDGLEHVFVYVKDGLGNRVFPVPSEPVVLDQRGCTYVPHVFGVQVGQVVEIRNSDATLHTVHARAKRNGEFNTAQPAQGMAMKRLFTHEEVLLPFTCDVHGWMNAYAGVVSHPYHAVTGADGAFALEGVPPGTYTIEAVHETLGAQAQTITLSERDSKELAFIFES